MPKKISLTDRMIERIEKRLSFPAGSTLRELGAQCFQTWIEDQDLVLPGQKNPSEPGPAALRYAKVERERLFQENIEFFCELAEKYLQGRYFSKNKKSQPDQAVGGGLHYEAGHYRRVKK